MTKDRKEREAYLGHLDNWGLLDLMEPLGVLGVLAIQVSPSFTVQKGGGSVYIMALTF